MNKRLPIFGITCIAVLAVLLSRLWTLKLLYLDSDVRVQVQQALELTAEEEGFLLSGFSIRSLNTDQVSVTHRAHARGEDVVTCFDIDLLSLTRAPCEDSSSL